MLVSAGDLGATLGSSGGYMWPSAMPQRGATGEVSCGQTRGREGGQQVFKRPINLTRFGCRLGQGTHRGTLDRLSACALPQGPRWMRLSPTSDSLSCLLFFRSILGAHCTSEFGAKIGPAAVNTATSAPHGTIPQVTPVSSAENGCKLTPHPLIPNIRI